MQTTKYKNTRLLIKDNGSDTSFLEYARVKDIASKVGEFVVVRNAENTGNYPLFKQALGVAKGEVIAFIHGDVFIYQKDWDLAVTAVFQANAGLGLVGFLGSTQLDNWAGRGAGTVSNMQGRTVGKWKGSPAEAHGKRDRGFILNGVVVDGCVMIFRKSVLEKIEVKELPPHH